MMTLNDFRFATRLWRKHLGHTFLAVLTLALGMGLTTAMFSILDGAVLEGLPFEEPGELMELEGVDLSVDRRMITLPLHDFVDMRERQTSFEDLGASTFATVILSGSEERPEQYQGAHLTASTFDLLRVKPILGRSFQEVDERPGSPPVMLIGFALWKSRFQGNPEIVGRTVRANGETMAIAGVMPEGFGFPIRQDLWISLRLDPLATPRGEGPRLVVFGRLRDGVSLEAAQAEVSGIARQIEAEHPETNQGIQLVVGPYVKQVMGKEVVQLSYTMLGAVFGVLLIACFNVTNLLLSRSALRTKEVAIRSALGASRARVAFQLLSETFCLAAAGAVFGLGIARIGVDLFNESIRNSPFIPFWVNVRVDGSVLAFASALILLASLASGVVPAIQASGTAPNEVLKEGSRGSSSLRVGRLSRALVIAEIALSCGLLVGAGLAIQSVVNLKNVRFGFATADVFTARIFLPATVFPDLPRRDRFLEELGRRLEGKPRVQGVALTSSFPAMGSPSRPFCLDGGLQSPANPPVTQEVSISPRYFDTFGVRLLEGRDFQPSDGRDAAPVAIVNQSFVERFLPGEPPVGRRLRFGCSDPDEPWRRIVGVVPDMLGTLNRRGVAATMSRISDDNPVGVYVPLTQGNPRFMGIAIRTPGPPLAFTPIVRNEVAAIHPDVAVYAVNTLARAIAEQNWFYGLFASVFSVFGVSALFLAAVGLYGVMAFSVSRRRPEVGIRMALGARRGDVLRLIMKQGMSQLGLGLVAGMSLAVSLSRLFETALFEVEPWDRGVYLSVAVSLALTGVLASIVPAWRAARVDPQKALRYE